jgi:NO-binding membrane sensor protein with MHYT domain
MVEVSQLTYGWINPALGFGMSLIGSLLGLVCAARARDTGRPGSPAGWYALAAVSIGGTGVWLAHFLMALGFSVANGPVRYSAGLTILSALIAIAVTGAGMIIAGPGSPPPLRLAGAGAFTGLGFAAMNYTGLAAVHVRGQITYRPVVVAAFVVLAVGAATAAIWLTTTVRGVPAASLAALVIALAVVLLHYTGMAAVQVAAGVDPPGGVPGADPSRFLGWITLAAGAAVMTVLYFVFTAPDELERAAMAGLRELLLRTEPELIAAAAAAAQAAPEPERTPERGPDPAHGGKGKPDPQVTGEFFLSGDLTTDPVPAR